MSPTTYFTDEVLDSCAAPDKSSFAELTWALMEWLKAPPLFESREESQDAYDDWIQTLDLPRDGQMTEKDLAKSLERILHDPELAL